MPYIYLLTVYAGHEFDAVRQRHQSAHASYDNAESYAVAHAVPICQAQEEPEWHDCFHYEVIKVKWVPAD